MSMDTTTSNNAILSVTASYPVADVGSETLLRLAAVAPADSGDPVDLALIRSVAGIPPVESFSPAQPDRKYSLAIARQVAFGGTVQDVAIMRGDVNSVLADSAHDSRMRSVVQKKTNAMAKLGRRCMGVAFAPVEGNTTGEFRFQGIVAIAVGNHRRITTPTRAGYARIDMWPRALRIQHWLNFILIVTMSVTGYYIMNPLFGPDAAQDTGYLMGTIRFIHFIAGFCWIAVALWRLSLTVFATTKQMQWRSLWPIYSKQDMKYMGQTIQYYLFLKKAGPHYTGHNALQQFTYTSVYALCLVQMLTGLALYGLYNQYHVIWQVFTYPVHLLGIPVVRMIHAIIMFIIWAFVVLHVYLTFRADTIEQHGGVSAMINGGVWLPLGTKPVDGPEIE